MGTIRFCGMKGFDTLSKAALVVLHKEFAKP